VKTRYKKMYDNVMNHYHEHGRHHLPWRKQITPYRVVVSEIMLQQTQVDRVIPLFNAWMKQFPSWRALADAPQSKVLRVWKGLGYNSRALRLQKLAQLITKEYKGKLPKTYDQLVTLPGIGPYTAGAVCAFAYNEYIPIIETNIRRIFIHYFFKDAHEVTDTEILSVIDDIGIIENPREWYAALMDYGSTLPKIVRHNPNTKSRHYTKQSTFKGSDRQLRGQILALLLEKQTVAKDVLFKQLGRATKRYQTIIDHMEKEGFVQQTKNRVTLR